MAPTSNELLDAHRAAVSAGTVTPAVRANLVSTFGFAIPTDEAIAAIARHAGQGVVEIGAGIAFWAHLLHRQGIDVLAFDLHPPPSDHNPWFANVAPWHPVESGDHSVAAKHAERALLIIWPTKDEVWASEALAQYAAAGGAVVAYVGEGPGGRTGDDLFHATLGDLTTCMPCTYGSTNSPCICGTTALWQRRESIRLPQWPGYDDALHIYGRTAPMRLGGQARFEKFRRRVRSPDLSVPPRR